MGAVHAVGEDMGRRSDIDRTDDFDLGTCGSWLCGEGMGNSHLWPRKRSFISVSEGVTWLEGFICTTEPYYDRLDSRLPQIRVRCQVDIDRMPSSDDPGGPRLQCMPLPLVPNSARRIKVMGLPFRGRNVCLVYVHE